MAREREESRHFCLFIAPRTSSYVHTPLASSTQNITIRLPKYWEYTHIKKKKEKVWLKLYSETIGQKEGADDQT